MTPQDFKALLDALGRIAVALERASNIGGKSAVEIFDKWLEDGNCWTGGNQGDYGLESVAVRDFIKNTFGGK